MSDPAETLPLPPRGRLAALLREQLRNIAPFATLIALVAFFTLASPSFATVGNLQNVATQVSVTAIIAVGLTFVILCAEIDLSVAAVANAIGILVSVYYGFAAIACTVFYRKALTRSIKGFVFAGVYPLLSGLALFVLAGSLIYQDWTTTDKIALDASNTRFQVIVPVAVILAGIVALIYSAIVRRPPFYRMARETAEAEALSRRTSRLETARVE